MIVAYQNGDAVRLSDVATVVEGPENSELAAWANRTPAIILNMQRQPGSNVIAVVDAVKAALPKLEKSLPAGLDVRVLSDQTTTIRASVNDVEMELGLSVVLVVLVIFVFLRNLPATLIPSLSVPLSLVGTLAAMYLFGFSLDNLSLMSLTIATGFVVDDAIVMIENISRYVEAGRDAAGRGAARLRRDRLHDHFADRVTDRRADPAAVHGRRDRAAVLRIRGDAGDDHRAVGGGVADTGADAVRADGPPSPRAGARNRFDLAAERGFELDHPAVRPGTAAGCWTTRA